MLQHIIVDIQLKAFFHTGTGLAISCPVNSFPASVLFRIAAEFLVWEEVVVFDILVEIPDLDRYIHNLPDGLVECLGTCILDNNSAIQSAKARLSKE